MASAMNMLTVKGSLLKKKNIKLVHATATVKIQTKTGQLMR